MSTVAMDCEMVGSGGQCVVARVSIVDYNGSVLLDEYVKPTAPIDDYRYFVSGSKRQHLDNGKSLSEVKSDVYKLTRDKSLVVHSLQLDLDALGLLRSNSNLLDLAKYEPFMKNGQPQSLKDLAKMLLIKDIQEDHDSVTGAQTAMELFRCTNVWY